MRPLFRSAAMAVLLTTSAAYADEVVPSPVVLDDAAGEALAVTTEGDITSSTGAEVQVDVNGQQPAANYTVDLTATNGGDVAGVELEADGEGKDLRIGLQAGDTTDETADGGNTGGVKGTVNGDFENITVTEIAGDAVTGQAGDTAGIILDVDGTSKQITLIELPGSDLVDEGGQGAGIQLTFQGETDGILAQTVHPRSENAVAGKVTIILEDGSKVNGLINIEAGLNSELVFAMQAVNKTEFDAVTETLRTSGANGSITIQTIDGPRTYNWAGVGGFKNAMSYIAEHHPDTPVDVVVTPPGSPTPPTTPGDTFYPTPTNGSSTSPSPVNGDYWCNSRNFEVKPAADGVVLKVKDASGNMIEFGQVANQTYTSNGATNLQVRTGGDSKVDFAKIFQNGKEVGACKWPAKTI